MARRSANDSSRVATLLSVPKPTYTRDFKSENIRRLTEIQDTISVMREPVPESPKFKLKQFADVPAKVTTYMERSPSENRDPHSESRYVSSAGGKRKPAAVSDPGAVPARFTRPEIVPKKPSVPKATETLKYVGGVQVEHASKDFLSDNFQKAAVAKPAARSPKSKVPVEPKHSEFGEVPAYLKERQAIWAKEAEIKRKAEEEKDVPPGMRLMPEAERLETLQLLRAGIAETTAALSKFRLNVVVPSQLRRKAELESKLAQLEEAIGVFSKTRVFVKLDA